MGLQTTTVTNAWPASPSYTTAATADVMINNAALTRIVWAVTADDTAPSAGPQFASPVEGRRSHALQLEAGERLWLAAPSLPAGVTASVGLQD